MAVKKETWVWVGSRALCTAFLYLKDNPPPFWRYRGADKSVARPGRKQARKHVRDVRDFNNIETWAVIKFFSPPARQGAEGNSQHSDRNISLFASWSGWGLISTPVNRRFTLAYLWSVKTSCGQNPPPPPKAAGGRLTVATVIFFHGTTAPSGPEPSQHRGLTLTLRHTTLGRTPLDEWSARRRDHYLHNTQRSQQTDIHAPRKIRSCDPSSERPKAHALDHAASAIGRYGNAAFKKPVFIESITYILNRGHITFHQTSSQRIHSAPTLNVATQTMIKRRIHVWLERVCSQTQLCQLRCFNDYTILDNYMFQPLLAIFRLSLREIKVLLYILCAHVMERSLHTCLTL